MYTINKGQMETFLKIWREQVVPLRQKHGFTVDWGWVVDDENRFVWMVSYENGEGWDAALDSYMNSPDRKTMNPEPGSFVAHMEVRFVTSAL
jgi:hypothetical protein